MPDKNAMTSADFEIMYNSSTREPVVDADAFREVFDSLGVDTFIEARRNEHTLMMSEDQGVAVHMTREDVEYRGYAYLSEPGYLQIWMEAISQEPEPVLLAVARFSWNRQPETEEQHGRYVELLRARIEA